MTAPIVAMLGTTLALLASTSQTAPSPWRVSLATDKAVYLRGEPVQLTLEVVNTSDRPLTLHFSTSQRCDFTMHDSSGQEVWRWAQERMFLQVLGQETIEAGGRRVFKEKYLGTPAAGTHRITGGLTASESTPPAFASIEFR